jgi:hypothetical protein
VTCDTSRDSVTKTLWNLPQRRARLTPQADAQYPTASPRLHTYGINRGSANCLGSYVTTAIASNAACLTIAGIVTNGLGTLWSCQQMAQMRKGRPNARCLG